MPYRRCPLTPHTFQNVSGEAVSFISQRFAMRTRITAASLNSSSTTWMVSLRTRCPLVHCLAALRTQHFSCLVWMRNHCLSVVGHHSHACCLTEVNQALLVPSGDSHSLSPSWHTLSVNGTPRLLIPALVTGLKACTYGHVTSQAMLHVLLMCSPLCRASSP